MQGSSRGSCLCSVHTACPVLTGFQRVSQSIPPAGWASEVWEGEEAMGSALAVRVGSSSASPFPQKMDEGAVSEGQAPQPWCCTGAVEVSLINETVMLGCYTALLRQERCPRTGWKCRAPRGFPRASPSPGLVSSSQHRCLRPGLCCLLRTSQRGQRTNYFQLQVGK